MSSWLAEIVNVDLECREELEAWWRERYLSRLRALDGFVGVEVWQALRDDERTFDSEACRLLLLCSFAGEVFSSSAYREVSAIAETTPGVDRHERYEATAVSRHGRPDRPARQQARGLRFVAMNCLPGAEAEFDAWYEQDHLPKFADLDEVIEGRRLRASSSERRQIAVYWLTTPEIVDDARWRAAASTRWTESMRAKTRDRDRLVLVPAPGWRETG